MKKITLTEHEEAVLLAQYLEILQTQGKIELYSHIPSETFTKNWGTKIKNKQEGVEKGVPDYIVVTKLYVIFVELKRVKGSTTSPEQQEWVVRLHNKTTKSFIAYGFDSAKEFIDVYI